MASANATKEKNIDLEKLDLDDLERQLEEDFGEDLDRELAERLAELDFVDALYFDATNKPPATFGWE